MQAFLLGLFYGLLLHLFWPPWPSYWLPFEPFTGFLLSLFYGLLWPFYWPPQSRPFTGLLLGPGLLSFLCRSLFVVLLLRLFTGLLSFYWPPSEHLLCRAFFFLFTGILYFLPSILYALHFLQSPFTSCFILFLSLFTGLLLLLLSILTGRLSPSCGRLR